jgi:hypothetical protein
MLIEYLMPMRCMPQVDIFSLLVVLLFHGVMQTDNINEIYHEGITRST